MSASSGTSGKNTSMTMTVGNKQPQDTSTTSESEKKNAAGKENATPGGPPKGGLSKLKDPNQAHETLEM